MFGSRSRNPASANRADDTYAAGWRVHDSARGWINQVDAKAAAALAIESVVLGFVIVLTSNPEVLSRMAPTARWILSVAVAALALSVVLAVLTIVPRTKLRESIPGRKSFLYFGHLRNWDRDELTTAIVSGRVDAGELSEQIIVLSRIAWRKHLLLEFSLYLLTAGFLVAGAVYLILVLGLFPNHFGDLASKTTWPERQR